MITQVRDVDGSEHDGSCEGEGRYLDLRATLEVESVGFSEGLDAGVRMIPGTMLEQWVESGAISQGGRAWGGRDVGGGREPSSGPVIFEATNVTS